MFALCYNRCYFRAHHENKIEISGGNHAYFGNYGEQKGDGKATITREEQQKIAVKEIMEFINEETK